MFNAHTSFEAGRLFLNCGVANVFIAALRYLAGPDCRLGPG
jgi:hypothetical protein